MTLALTCTSEQVLHILQTKVGTPTTVPAIENQTWEELGVDSLGVLEVCGTLEVDLGMVIPPAERVASTHTIPEFVKLINSYNA